MRHEVLDEFPGRTAPRTASSARSPRIDLIGLFSAASLLFLTASTAIAEGPRSIDLDGISPPAALAMLAVAAEIPDEIALPDATPEPPVHSIVPDRSEAEPLILEELLTLRSMAIGLPTAKTTDELLAAAVALGTNPDLEPKKPFRKRSRDLFRTERPVSIGNRDMLVRLRLRAKARRAMSVEVRF